MGLGAWDGGLGLVGFYYYYIWGIYRGFLLIRLMRDYLKINQYIKSVIKTSSKQYLAKSVSLLDQEPLP